MQNDPQSPQRPIMFRGSEEYRFHVQELARARRLKVQRFLELAVERMEADAKSASIPPETKVTISPLTENEKGDKSCVTPQELDLRRTLSFIMNSGNERIIAHVSGVLDVSEDFVRLGVANGPADAEPPPPGDSQTPSDPELSKKLGGNVQNIGRGAKRLRGKRGERRGGQ